MKRNEILKTMQLQVVNAAEDCTDLDLLDLVWKLLLEAQPTPPPEANIVRLEVLNNVHDQGNTEQHGAVPVKVRGGVKHTRPNHTEMGAGRKSMPGVCGGADSLPRAA